MLDDDWVVDDDVGLEDNLVVDQAIPLADHGPDAAAQVIFCSDSARLP